MPKKNKPKLPHFDPRGAGLNIQMMPKQKSNNQNKELRREIEEILKKGTPRLQYMGSIPEMSDKLLYLFNHHALTRALGCLGEEKGEVGQQITEKIGLMQGRFWSEGFNKAIQSAKEGIEREFGK